MSASRAYPEADARRWLSWIARYMQDRGETVLMIENLQPDSLTGPQLWVYGLASRIAGATIAFTLFFMFPAILLATLEPVGLGELLAGTVAIPFMGTLAGLVVGTVVGLSVIAKFERRRGFSILARAAVVGLVALLIVFVQWLAASDGDSELVMVGMAILATPFVILWTRRVSSRTIDDDIRPIESLRFSWKTFRQRAFRKWWLYLLLLPFGSYIVFAINCVRAVFAAYTVAPVDRKTRPNEGIRLSLRNAFFAWGSLAMVGAAAGLAVGILASLNQNGLPFTGPGSVTGLIVQATKGVVAGGSLLSVIGIFFGFWYGGLDAVNHFTLRTVLWLGRSVPLRLPRFLDHASRDLGFLQPVGGGYMFIHRYLLEHFARTGTTREASVPAAVTVEPAIS